MSSTEPASAKWDEFLHQRKETSYPLLSILCYVVCSGSLAYCSASDHQMEKDDLSLGLSLTSNSRCTGSRCQAFLLELVVLPLYLNVPSLDSVVINPSF